jgi:two-component system, OmpR family, response regulator ChvI
LTNQEAEEQVKEVQFLGSQNYCVCFVHTSYENNTAVVNDLYGIRTYYTTFINTMSNIARQFGARMVKNITDTLIVYFPRTSNSSNVSAFSDVIECGITLLAAGDAINSELNNNPPSVTYKISADYGKVEVAKSMTSIEEDLFGPTMNLCAKINSKAPANHMVIGGDLYLLLKSFYSQAPFKHGDYEIKELKGLSVKSKNKRIFELSDTITSRFGNKHASKDCLNQIQIQLQQPDYSRHNIMIIDDEKDILFSFKQGLTHYGYSVEAFSDAREALRRFGQVDSSHFELVILDLRMPGINGIELYRELKLINNKIKILIVTALDVAPELASLFPDLVRSNILKKPIGTDELINSIKGNRS